MIRFINSLKFAFNGIRELLLRHRNAQIEFFFALLAILFGLFLRISAMEWIALVLCICAVLALEGLNSALEQVVDLVSPDHHPLAGKAKDLAAGAVLLAAVGAAVVGAILFIPKLIALW
jgi:diacylglycerol kinase (ATP)